MIRTFRLNEYKVLIYRILLIYLFYFISRILFYSFNRELFGIDSFTDLLKLCYYGLSFDTTALLYINSLFILISILPLTINTNLRFQKFLLWLYFTLNILTYSTNFIDIIYYRFSQVRSTRATLDVLVHENNKSTLLSHFIGDYWYIIALFLLCSLVWIWLYKKVNVKVNKPHKRQYIAYFLSSAICILLTATLIIGGIRGGFKHSTRPINLVDAYRHVRIPNQGDIVLNTPFSIFRTLKVSGFKVPNWTNANYINQHIKPIKQYKSHTGTQPNVVIFILESMGREYWGSMNKDSNIPNFKSYTPFLDSLSESSLIFTNGYANGRQSIHAMSSILAGIPSFQTAFTSSPYAKQDIQSLISISNSAGYQTSFFHGAANGSMGFLGFSKLLGIKDYYGRTEYNNDADYDGIWGIWDEPFFQFMSKTLTKQKKPFLATMFSISSHDPFKIPEKYQQQFLGGPMPIDKCVQYTDHALRKFFEHAKTQAWYQNTIFVITADHTNQINYEEYSKPINRFAVPILFFSPNKALNLKGVRTDLASQTDIYPSVIDLIGYHQPFRSWGRSLIANNPDETPRVINSPGNIYQFMEGNYTYIFDGEKFSGVFAIKDTGLQTNLISNPDPEIKSGMENCKAYIQDYMYRVTNKLLNH
ncbi:LTA synthase family protein [Pedobacter sp.]|uniref:LTA synthase family protein n=1 Tax=Pedobacter sp. TaxID=1411316 RepID=UPI003D7FE565